jgi:hypothetical protein
MVKETKGTYRIAGDRMTFRRGLLAKNGQAAGITCTYVTDRKVSP